MIQKLRCLLFLFLIIILSESIATCQENSCQKGALLAGPITIPANMETPTEVGIVLEKDKSYFVVGEGTCSLWDGQEDGCDSVYRYRTPLEPNGGEIKIWGQLELVDPSIHLSDLIEKNTGKPAEYNPSHIYEAVVIGEGKTFKARVNDGGGYGDNHGELKISVYEAMCKEKSSDPTSIKLLTTIMHPTKEELDQWEQDHDSAPEAPEAAAVGSRLNIQQYDGDSTASGGTHFNLLDYLDDYHPSDRFQGGCGNCWEWTTTGMMEIALAYKYGVKDQLSVQYLNSNLGDKACCGGNLKNAAYFYANSGKAISWENSNAQWQDARSSCEQGSNVPASSISTLNNYPIKFIEYQQIITKGVGKETAIDKIKAVLHSGKAIYFAFTLPNSYEWEKFQNDFWDRQLEDTIWQPDLPYSSNLDDGYGSHAVLCVGYDDTDPNNRYWIMLNSWGAPTNRPNGLFRVDMDMNYDCKSGQYYSFKFDTLDIGFDTSNKPTPPPLKKETPIETPPPLKKETPNEPVLQPSLNALYFWFNPSTGDSYYTLNPNGDTAANAGYVYEYVIGYISASQQPGTTPLYGWWSESQRISFYTTNPNAIDPSYGYVFAKIVGYISTSQQSGTTALYEWQRSANGSQFLTTDPSGGNSQSSGYSYRGVIGYIWTSNSSGGDKTYEITLYI
jgi:C1A family cysteine protease